jgi:hypothetical protein
VSLHSSLSDKVLFFHLTDKECATSYGADSTPAVLIFRKFDNSDKPLVFNGNWETEPLVDWITASSLPTLIDFSEEYVDSVFGQKKAAIILFRKEEDSDKNF